MHLLEVYGIPTICFITAVHWLEWLTFSLWSRLLEREREDHPNNVWHPFALFTGGVNSELLREGGFVPIFCDIRFICIMSWDHRRWCHFWIGLTVADTSCVPSVLCPVPSSTSCAQFNWIIMKLHHCLQVTYSLFAVFHVQCALFGLSCAVNIVHCAAYHVKCPVCRSFYCGHCLRVNN